MLRHGLVAEDDMIGTWAFSPRSTTNFACIEVCGPMIACTCTFLIRSRAVHCHKEANKL